MNSARSVLVLITGLPGSGKSTVAHALAAETALPIVSRDGSKAIVFSAVSGTLPDDARRVGAASWELLFETMRAAVSGGAQSIVDANFSRTRHGATLQRLVDGASVDVIELHCSAEPDVLYER